MNNAFNKGVLDAKLSRLLSENDFATFKSLSDSDRLTFFINHDLVTTNITTNFEALCLHARLDLKAEVLTYVKSDSLTVQYFFARDYVKNESGATAKYLNDLYQKALKAHEMWLVSFMDYTHAAQNILTLLRGKRRGDSDASILAQYLHQSLISEEVFTSLLIGDAQNVYASVKALFNVDIDPSDTLVAIETKLDEYVMLKTKELAIESELAPTLIYYIKMKEHEILRLRQIQYGERSR